MYICVGELLSTICYILDQVTDQILRGIKHLQGSQQVYTSPVHIVYSGMSVVMTMLCWLPGVWIQHILIEGKSDVYLCGIIVAHYLFYIRPGYRQNFMGYQTPPRFTAGIHCLFLTQFGANQ